MQTITQQITAGLTWAMAEVGAYFQIFEAPAAVDVRFMRNGKVIGTAEQMGAGFYARPAEGFDRIEIASATTQTIKIGISDGTGGTNQMTGSVVATVKTATSIVNVPFKTVGTVEVLAAAANANRLGLRFLNSGGTNIALGGAGLAFADAAIVLAPGQLWVEADAPGAAWVALSDMAGGTLKVQELTA